MKRNILDKGKDYFRAVLRLWRRVPLRVQGMVTIGLPLLAVIISATLALIGNHQRANIEADVQRKFQMTAALSEVLTLMVNAETGMRGYLLTKREEFLQPFAIASENLPAAMAPLPRRFVLPLERRHDRVTAGARAAGGRAATRRVFHRACRPAFRHQPPPALFQAGRTQALLNF